jgi:putative ABC transport system permease protein
MMSPKLALNNVRKSIRDYSIYFITIAFGVCIFYVFNSIESQQVMMDPSSSQKFALEMLSRFMNGFSLLISAVLCFLIIYANGFLIKRRKKEFGIYLILGMEKGTISRILVMETALVGFAGLIIGMLLGILISQGMALVTAQLMNSKVASYHFVFSSSAVIKTCIYFGLTFLLTLVFNIITINKQRLIDLLNSARKNERFTPPRLGRSIVIFIVALLLLGGAYYFITRDSFFLNQAVFLAGASLAVSGTFLFFLSLSGFFLRLIQQCKSVYLRNLNMFVLRQINSKIHTTYVSMTFVCLMIALSITALSTGSSVAGAFAAEQREGTPFDVTFTLQQTEQTEDGYSFKVPYQEVDVAAGLKEKGLDLAMVSSAYSVVPMFESPFSLTVDNGGETPLKIEPNIIRLSDFNASLAMQGLPPLTLADNSFALQSNGAGESWTKLLHAYLESEPTIEMKDAGDSEASPETLRSNPSLLQNVMVETSSTRVEEMNLIVPDRYVGVEGEGAFPVTRTMLNVNYEDDTIDNSTVVEERYLSLFQEKSLTSSDGVVLGFWTETRTDALQVGSTATTIVAYVALYLGVVFLIASAALLAIAQLSEASDNVTRYRLLAKIGTEDRLLRRALFSQIAIYFGAPLTLALIHSVVGIYALSVMFVTLKDMSILSGSVLASLIILLVYGGYFLATYAGSKGILNREAIHRLAQD